MIYITPAKLNDLNEIFSFITNIKNEIDSDLFVCSENIEVYRKLITESPTFIVKNNGKIIGTCITHIRNDDFENVYQKAGIEICEIPSCAIIESIQIDCHYRNQNLGYNLLTTTINYLKMLGFKRILTTVHPNNKPSLTIFKKNGFKELKQCKLYGELDRIILVKENFYE